MPFLRPQFFIIGERKCGTSSLFRYLLAHPQVLPGRRKELQFFSRGPKHVEEHFAEYLTQFPPSKGSDEVVLAWPELDESGTLYEEGVRFERRPDIQYVTGEASADTFCEVPPALLRQYLPDLKLIVILRDPVERAYSHHRMFKRFQDEGRDLNFRVGDFADDMRAELIALRAGKETPCLSPGLYVGRLKSWIEEWGETRLLVLFAADLNNRDRRAAVMRSVFAHLGLSDDDTQLSLAQRYNQAPEHQLPAEIRDELESFYRPHDEALQHYLGREIPWGRLSGQ